MSLIQHKKAAEDTAKQPEPEPQEPQAGPKALWTLSTRISFHLVPSGSCIQLGNDFVLSAYYRVSSKFQGREAHEKYIPIPKYIAFRNLQTIKGITFQVTFLFKLFFLFCSFFLRICVKYLFFKNLTPVRLCAACILQGINRRKKTKINRRLLPVSRYQCCRSAHEVFAPLGMLPRRARTRTKRFSRLRTSFCLNCARMVAPLSTIWAQDRHTTNSSHYILVHLCHPQKCKSSQALWTGCASLAKITLMYEPWSKLSLHNRGWSYDSWKGPAIPIRGTHPTIGGMTSINNMSF